MQLLESYPVEFYVSDSGYLVIEQNSIEFGKDAFFLISPEQTKILFNLLPEIMQEQKTKWTGIYNPDEK
jgi:hypothetical protein